MNAETPVLHLVCGKAASGKSTQTRRLGAEGGLVISEDDWLAALYGGEMKTLKDYVRCAGLLRGAMGPHVVELLQAGLSVVLDYPANTVEARRWMRGLAEAAEVPCRLHFLDVSDETCKARLRARNASGDHPFTLTEAQFDQLAAHFEPPEVGEGFEIVRYEA